MNISFFCEKCILIYRKINVLINDNSKFEVPMCNNLKDKKRKLIDPVKQEKEMYM
jgi:hypothetical protein